MRARQAPVQHYDVVGGDREVLKGVLGSGLMSSPTRMFGEISDAAPSLTTDSAMSMTDLFHIGMSLRGLAGKDVQFVTAPNAMTR